MIPMTDLAAQHRALKHEMNQAIQEILLSADFVLGPAVKKLEEQVAAFCGCSHGVGVGSGTDALRLALAAMGVGPGDEVITTPFTFVATAHAISRCGATPVFVDIDPKTFNIDPRAVAAAVTARTKVILPVHLYGQAAEMDPLLAVAAQHGLFVLEDCAQAIGASRRGRRVGSIGHAGALSFYPTKNLGACGDGGMVVTRDASLAEKVEILRSQGSKTKHRADLVGFNSRLDSIQAAILSIKLRHLDAWNQRRRIIAKQYDDMLEGLPIGLPRISTTGDSAYHQYTITTPMRDQLALALRQHGVETHVYYPVPIHLQAAYCRRQPAPSLPQAERAAREVLSLPIYPELTLEQQQEVVKAIRGFFFTPRTAREVRLRA